LVLTNTEKTFLSFYSIFSEENKAEYSFVLENFHILAKFLLEPVEDNFFNLISKLKTYKNVSCYDRERNNKEKNKGKPDYDDKLKILQASIRLMLIFFSLMISYITLIGKETIIVLYTKTWASESTVRLTKLYSLYLGLLAINGIIEAYANAIISEKMMNYFRRSLVVNSVLLVLFSFYFTQFDISGLILANCICLILRILFSLYLILVKNEDEDKPSGSNLLQNIYEIMKFFYFCLYKSLSLLFIIVCLILLKSAKSVVFLQECLPLLLMLAGIVIFINCYIVFSLEKKKFSEVFKMKDAEIII